MKLPVSAKAFPLPLACVLTFAAGLLPLRADYTAWQTEHFTPAQLGDAGLEASLWGESADPDRDGLLNLAEYAFGGNPLLADRHRGPALSLDGAEPELGFEKVRADIQYRVEYAADLAAPAWSSDGLDTWHAELDSLEAGQPVSIAFSAFTPGARFARLRVSGQPPARMPFRSSPTRAGSTISSTPTGSPATRKATICTASGSTWSTTSST